MSPRGPGEMPFLDHLEELRWRLIWALGALAVGALVGFFLVSELDVIGLLARPIRELLPSRQLVFTNPTTPVMVTLKLAVVVGIVLAFPFLAYHAWAFLSPALYEREKKVVVPTIAVSFLLFLAGLAMAYFLALPLGLRFMLGFQAGTLEPLITVDEYLRFATQVILGFGIVFELPIVLGALAVLGIVDADLLRKYRRHALVVMAALAAIVTPADVGTMLLMLVPMWLLYEASVGLVVVVDRRRERGRVGSGAPRTPGEGTERPEGA